MRSCRIINEKMLRLFVLYRKLKSVIPKHYVKMPDNYIFPDHENDNSSCSYEITYHHDVVPYL